jgi:hypothetical protein
LQTLVFKTGMQDLAIKQQIRLIEFRAEEHSAEWDALVSRSPMGTLLHTRKFLSYHGERFDDRSLLIADEANKLLGVFPAAVSPGDKQVVITHPGVTYGGIVHDGSLRGSRMLEAMQSIAGYYADRGFKELKYKAVPFIYHSIPMQEDIYALSRLGAIRYRCDISATADLSNLRPMSTRRRRCLAKAEKCGVELKLDFAHLSEFWDILKENLASKHEKTPVHSVAELTLLKERFDDEIQLVVALSGGRVVAGSLLFDTPSVCHAQYFASTADGRAVGALDAVVNYSFALAKSAGRRFFDFGISSDIEGTYLNDGLHSYKIEFGSGTTVYEFYNVSLPPKPTC